MEIGLLRTLPPLLLAFGLVAPAVAQNVPIEVAAPAFALEDGSNGAAAQLLAPAELAEFERAIATMVAFPEYLYSGCHDRAHAAFLLLPEPLRAKTRKIWLAAPGRYTAAVPGAIKLRATDEHSRAVRWLHHVALVIETEDGARIFDPALAPKRLLTRAEWLELMDMPPLTISFVSRAGIYIFANAKLDFRGINADAKGETHLWNGIGFTYEGYSTENRRIPRELARDRIGVLAMQGTACQPIIDMRTQPQTLYDFLNNPASAAANPDCGAQIALYGQEVARWRALLPGHPD